MILVRFLANKRKCHNVANINKNLYNFSIMKKASVIGNVANSNSNYDNY